MPTYDLEILIRTKKQGEGVAAAGKEIDGFGKKLNGTLDTLNKSAVAAAAAGATFKKAFELGQEGAGLNQLTESFELMNEQVFHTPGLLEDMSAAARGTIKETDLMKGLLTLTAGASTEMAQAFAGAAPKLLEIAKASNKLNPALGDTSFLYDSIATGVKRASPLILDNLGIVVKIGDANEKYAASLGKTVDQLTAEEKQMALLNATLTAGDQLINQVGGSVDSQTDSWARLEVQVGSFTDKLKMGFAERVGPAMSGLATVIDKLQLRQGQLTEAVDRGIISQYDHFKIIRGATLGIDRYEEQLRDTVKLLEDMKIGTDHWRHSAGLTAEQVADLTQETESLTAGLENHEHWQELVNERTEFYAAVADDAARNADRYAQEEENLAAHLANTGETLGLTTKEAEALREAQQGLRTDISGLNEALAAQDAQLMVVAAHSGDLFVESLKLAEEETNLIDLLFQSADAAGADAEALALLKVARGELTKAEAAALIQEVALRVKAEELGRAIANNELTIGGAIGALEEFQETLAEPYKFELSVKGLSEMAAIKGLVDGMAGRHTRSKHTHENVTVNSTKDGSGSKLPSPASPSSVPGLASGGSFIVPPGFSNDSFLMGVSSGEEVNVTPAGRSGASGRTSLYFDFRGAYITDPDRTAIAIEDALSNQAIRADMIRRIG